MDKTAEGFEEDLTDFIHHAGDKVAIWIGIIVGDDGRYTDEENERIVAECRKRLIASRPSETG